MSLPKVRNREQEPESSAVKEREFRDYICEHTSDRGKLTNGLFGNVKNAERALGRSKK